LRLCGVVDQRPNAFDPVSKFFNGVPVCAESSGAIKVTRLQNRPLASVTAGSYKIVKAGSNKITSSALMDDRKQWHSKMGFLMRPLANSKFHPAH